jgi:hypothetical protein
MNVTVAGFVPNPSGRGTLGLLWECLFSYSLCLWTAIHVDFYPGEDGGLLRANSKFHWSLLVFFLPEYALMQVIHDYWAARQYCKVRNRVLFRVPTTPDTNSLDESIPLADLQLRSRDHFDDASIRRSGQSPESEGVEHISACPVSLNLVGGKDRWEIAHGYLIRMGVLKFKLKDGDYTFPTTETIEKLSDCALLPTTKFLDERIQVLSQSDKLAKTLVCFQVLWLVLQTIARRIDGLPIALLELNTIAQIWVTLVLYALWWYKPQGIADSIKIDFRDCTKCQKLLREAGLTDMNSTRWTLPDNRAVPPPGSPRLFIFASIGLVSGVYIAIDAFGWNAYFPTGAERILWRVSVCAFAVGTVLCLPLVWLHAGTSDVANTLITLSVICSALSRLALTIEALAALRSLPVGVYNTPSWSDMLPHIG